MIDIQLLRNDIEAVAKRLATRGYELDVAGFNVLEEKRKDIQTRTEKLQAERNALAKEVGQAEPFEDLPGLGAHVHQREPPAVGCKVPVRLEQDGDAGAREIGRASCRERVLTGV